MTGEDFVKAQLALFGWREGSENGINGALAPIFVVRNRVIANWKSGDWLEVIGSNHEVSGRCTYPEPEYPDIRDPEFQKILHYVDGIYEMKTPDSLTDGALYFYDHKHLDPFCWLAKEVICKPEIHPRVASIGTMVFHK